MDETEKKSMVAEVGSWIWGTIQGGFNEKQTISQILVDAALSMIPVVGDVTAARDLIAVIIRLVEHPEKREDKLEWLTLVLLIFALIPVAGGAIKGVGRLIIEASEQAGKHAEILRDCIQLLNRLGEGQAIKFIKELNFEKYTGEITSKLNALVDRLSGVIDATIKRANMVIPDAMIARLRQIQQTLRELKAMGERMVPESLKELNRRLRAIQEKLYEGEWRQIGAAAKGVHREMEARLVETIQGGKTVKVWQAKDMPFPPSKDLDVISPHAAGALPQPQNFPDLLSPPWSDAAKGPWVINSFSGAIRPVYLKPGEKIRRVITSTSRKDGQFWLRELPKDGAAWRKDCAVLDRWSSNGYYIELTVPSSGMWVWEGAIASQVDNDAAAAKTFGQMLEGGASQLFIDFNMAAHAQAKSIATGLPLIPTNWKNFMGLNIPAKGVTAQKLSDYERAPKVAAAAGAAAKGTRAANSDQQSSGAPQ